MKNTISKAVLGGTLSLVLAGAGVAQMQHDERRDASPQDRNGSYRNDSNGQRPESGRDGQGYGNQGYGNDNRGRSYQDRNDRQGRDGQSYRSDNDGRNYHFRSEDRDQMRSHYRSSLRRYRGHDDRRRHFEAGEHLSSTEIRHFQRVPSSYTRRLPPPPPGYRFGYYQGNVVAYDPATRIIADVLDLMTQ